MVPCYAHCRAEPACQARASAQRATQRRPPSCTPRPRPLIRSGGPASKDGRRSSRRCRFRVRQRPELWARPLGAPPGLTRRAGPRQCDDWPAARPPRAGSGRIRTPPPGPAAPILDDRLGWRRRRQRSGITPAPPPRPQGGAAAPARAHGGGGAEDPAALPAVLPRGRRGGLSR